MGTRGAGSALPWLRRDLCAGSRRATKRAERSHVWRPEPVDNAEAHTASSYGTGNNFRPQTDRAGFLARRLPSRRTLVRLLADLTSQVVNGRDGAAAGEPLLFSGSLSDAL